MDDCDFQLYADESLESCLLRLSHFQGFERFSHFAQEMLFRFLDEHEAVSGALPFDLNQINIFHAQSSTQLRVRAIRQLESDVTVAPFTIMRLAYTRSSSHFSPDLQALHRGGIDFPRIMLRRKHTPICPKCVEQHPYIRHYWQMLPYQTCHIHHCDLLHHCPECHRSVDYQHSESITQCECGYSFANAETQPSDDDALLVAKWLTETKETLGELPVSMSLSERYGFLLWYVQRYGDWQEISLSSFVVFCQHWRQTLFLELERLAEDGDIKRVKLWQKTFFNEIFGSLLKDCWQLPYRELGRNVVLRAVLQSLSHIIETLPKKKTGNIGDVLVNVLEASALLSCTVDTVYQLYQQGEIKTAIKQPLHFKLASHQSAFTLRNVIETKYALMSSEHDGPDYYSMEWKL